jgi:hypothetical protein
MRLDTSVILGGQTVNGVNALAQGQLAGAAQQQRMRDGEYRNALAQFGAGAAQGDQNAIGQLARFEQFGPQHGAAIRQGDQQLEQSEQRLQIARQEAAMRAREFAAQMSAAERQQMAADAERVAGQIMMASPEQYPAILQQNGIDPAAYPIEARDQLIIELMGTTEGLGLISTGLDVQQQRAEANAPAPYGAIVSGEDAERYGLDPNQAYNLTQDNGVTRAEVIGGNGQTINIGVPGEGVDGGMSQPLSTMPTDTDFAGATGGQGFMAQFANTISDAVGLGLVDPNNERATQALQNLSTNTMIVLADGVAGRPSNFLLEQFQRLTVQPNSIWAGEGRTRERLNQTRDLITSAIRMNEDALRTASSDSMRAQARQNINRLASLQADYDVVIESFGRRENEGSQDVDLEERLRAYE